MKILHTADLHLGKSLNEYSLLDLQKEMLEELLDVVEKEEIELVLLAGDIYDRSLPPKEAVELLSSFLTRLTRRLGSKVIMISGNHDSHERLGYASEILSGMGLYIPSAGKEIEETRLGDVSVYSVPYLDRTYLSYLYEMSFKNLEEAFSHHISSIELDSSRFNIFMTHHYILGSAALEESESERPLFLGATENISAGLFKEFDYVALGHIHRMQGLADGVYYPGSPLKYSKGEATKTPGYLLLDTDTKKVDFRELVLSKDLVVKRGLFSELIKETSGDLVFFELEDDSYQPQAMARLKKNFPGALGLSYLNLSSNLSVESSRKVQSMDYLSLFEKFYLESLGRDLDKKERELVRDLLERSSHETY
ncbi:MAG: exonuclease SbcCD subunit D [Tissierellia bacterium]|nr:exonuclease SbcCD subunit D [Tissierellia bacterium]